MPDPELAVQVLDRLRPDLPLLLALSGGSPFWEGQHRRYASYCTIWFACWPVSGAPEVFGGRAVYDWTFAAQGGGRARRRRLACPGTPGLRPAT